MCKIAVIDGVNRVLGGPKIEDITYRDIAEKYLAQGSSEYVIKWDDGSIVPVKIQSDNQMAARLYHSYKFNVTKPDGEIETVLELGYSNAHCLIAVKCDERPWPDQRPSDSYVKTIYHADSTLEYVAGIMNTTNFASVIEGMVAEYYIAEERSKVIKDIHRNMDKLKTLDDSREFGNLMMIVYYSIVHNFGREHLLIKKLFRILADRWPDQEQEIINAAKIVLD